MKKYDLIWIGTGQAITAAMPRLVEMGKSVAIVEGGRFGGSCVNYGCTPTKTLVASARAAHMVRRGADFGVITGDVRIDFARVMERQNIMRQKTRQGLEQWLRGMDGVEIYTDYAAFAGPHTVRVGRQVIEGGTIVINVGGRARIPPLEGIEGVDWLDNDRLLDLQELPEHLVIVGGGYISLEFGQAFRRFGSQVTILEGSSQFMFREDPDIAAIAEEILAGEGVTIHLNAKVKRVAQEDGRKIVYYERDGQIMQVSGTHLLLAAGRIPNSDGLELDAAGVEVDKRGYIRVNDVTQTNVPHIYAVGDINGEGTFTHTSVNDGEIFWDHYSGSGDRTLSKRIPTYALFIDPPLGRVGMSERNARASGRNVLMATRPMNTILRAQEKDETAGMVKILVDADTEEFLGAAVFGVGGDEVINIFTPFMYTKGSYKQFRKAVLIHPTIAELMPWILDDLKPLK